MNNKPLINKKNFNYIFQKCPSVFLKLVCAAINFPEEVKNYHIITKNQLGLCDKDEYVEGNLFLIINDKYIIEANFIDKNDNYDVEEDSRKIFQYIINLNENYNRYKYIKINFDERPNATDEPITYYNCVAGLKNKTNNITQDDIDIYITKN